MNEFDTRNETSVPPHCVAEDGEWEPCFTCEVALAMSEAQASAERREARAFWAPPGSTSGLYHALDSIPEEKCIIRDLGWRKVICMKKEDAAEELKRLRPKDWQDWVARFDRVAGDEICLMGWGD